MPKGFWFNWLVIGAWTGAVLSAQTPRNAAADWQDRMKLAEKAEDREAALREVLKLAESFGESDLRLFQTVLRLAEVCQEDCGKDHPNYLDRALKMRSRIKPADDRFADALMDLGSLAASPDAVKVYGEAIDIRERVLGKTHQKVAEAYAAAARVYQLQKDPAQARRTMLYALEIREQAGAAGSAGYAELLLDSARIYEMAKDEGKARGEYERAIGVYERLWKPADARLIGALRRIAYETKWGDGHELSEALFRRVLDIQRRSRPNRQQHYEALTDLADFQRDQKRFSEAEATYLEALAVRRRMGKEDRQAAMCMRQVAECRFERKLYREAVEAGEASLGIHRRAADAVQFELLSLYELLIKANLHARDESKAEEYFKLLSVASVKGPKWYLISAAEAAGAIYQERGNYPRAAEKLALAIATREAANPEDSELPLQMMQLVQLYQKMGRVEDANRVSFAAMKLMWKNAVSRDGKDMRTVAIVGIAALVAFGAAVLAVCVLVYWQLAKRLDRRLAALFVTAVAVEIPTEGAVPEPSEPAVDQRLSAPTGPPAAGLAAVADGGAAAVGLALESADQLVSAPTGPPAASLTAVTDGGAAAVGLALESADQLVSAPTGPPAGLAAVTNGVAVAVAPALESVDEPMSAPTEVPAVPVPTRENLQPAPAAGRVTVDADASVLFGIRVLNLLLSLLTFGIYSFWGKAKVRRFVCSQSAFLGDRFAFHGTGRELLLGWLRALPALAFVFLFPQVLPVVWRSKASLWAAPLCGMAVFLLLWPIARVGAYRYRLNRMSWRGIRFSYRGTALRFLGASIGGGLVTLLTLGIYAPFLQIRLRRLLFRGTYFGDGDFQFSGRGKDLLPAWFFAGPLCFGTFGLAWAWWSALRHRYYWAHTTFAGARFRCTATGWRLLRLWIGNAVIITGTLGLGMSWAMLRTLRFWTKHIELVGDPQVTAIRQDARAASASGESFADFLGFDFGF